MPENAVAAIGIKIKGFSSQKTMKAAVFTNPHNIEIEELAIPIAGKRQVRVKLEGCGICGSNLPLWQGREWFNYPIEPGSPGHEGWGVIDQTGEDITDFREGDRVTYLGRHSFAQYEIVPVEMLVKIPQSLNQMPLPGEPFSCALNIFRKSGITEGKIVAVIGIGFIGAMLVQLSYQAGADVIAISRRPFSLSIAQKNGAKHLIEMDDHYKIINKVKEITNEKCCDVVIEAIGTQWPLDLAGELTAISGRLVIAGYHQDGLRHVNMQLWNWYGLEIINAHERNQQVCINGIKQAIKAIQSGTFCPDELLTHSYSIEKLNDAFCDLEERPEGFLKGYVKFE